ncbi:PMD domain-containing protein [Cephalotus follicularis]|uniref:PMD domain-containing protein n=1 Tax=Cephalotus follicularis TaxID=3775 RepID=A0A1Q3APN0_CEPFO|nr:PMD domain-containing protein [Cephalotus follicularis]
MVRSRGGLVNRGRAVLVVHPRRQSGEILKLQASDRLEDIWKGIDTELLYCRHHRPWALQYTLIPLIRQTGFFGIAQIGHIPLDHALITTLVERWRQETHSFHMVVGEMTVTLQDVTAL